MQDTKGSGTFSPEVIAIYQRIRQTDSPEERGELMLQLANNFADRYDASSVDLPERFHCTVDDYHQHYLAYNQAGLKLGRALVQLMEEKHVPTEADADTAISTTSSVN